MRQPTKEETKVAQRGGKGTRKRRRVQAKEALARVLPATGARQTTFNVSSKPSLSPSRADLPPFFLSFSFPFSPILPLPRTRFLVIDSLTRQPRVLPVQLANRSTTDLHGQIPLTVETCPRLIACLTILVFLALPLSRLIEYDTYRSVKIPSVPKFFVRLVARIITPLDFDIIREE